MNKHYDNRHSKELNKLISSILKRTLKNYNDGITDSEFEYHHVLSLKGHVYYIEFFKEVEDIIADHEQTSFRIAEIEAYKLSRRGILGKLENDIKNNIKEEP